MSTGPSFASFALNCLVCSSGVLRRSRWSKLTLIFRVLRGIYGRPGGMRIVWLFSFVLGNSRRLWRRLCFSQKLQTVLRCLVAAFAPGIVPLVRCSIIG